MMNLVIRREAQIEIQQVSDYYKNISFELEIEFKKDLDTAVELMLKFPESTPDVFGGFRKKLLFNFPYAIYFKIELDIIRIYAVIHERRNQPNWL